jgi:hypothetical protein
MIAITRSGGSHFVSKKIMANLDTDEIAAVFTRCGLGPLWCVAGVRLHDRALWASRVGCAECRKKQRKIDPLAGQTAFVFMEQAP